MTGLSFSIFGIGRFLLWSLIFPMMNLIPGSQAQKTQRLQKCVQCGFYLFIGLIHRIGIMNYEVTRLEKLNRPGQLIVANYPPLIDMVSLIRRIPAANCIVKDKVMA